jgi:diguanylate cyclase (GGDEF)-like protein
MVALAVAAALLFVPLRSSAATRPMRFDHLTIRDGLSQSSVLAIHQDRDGFVWLGTEDGLNRFDGCTHDPADPTSLSSDDVYALHVDRSGALWIGTTAGLNRLRGSAKAADRIRFERYTETDGLPNEVIYGIESDTAGNLWLSTNLGLSRFNPTAQSFENFGRSHGLQADEFNFGAHFRRATGEPLVGGNNGFNAFHPDRLARSEAAPPIVLTEFQKLDKSVETGVPLTRLDEIELDHRDDVVTFEFAALDFSALLVMLALVALVGAGKRVAASFADGAGAEVSDEVARLEVRIAELEGENRRLRESSLTDPLTGLPNRRFFEEQIAKEIALVRRRHREGTADEEATEPLDLVFMKIDLDGFRAIEETYGATVGDRLLTDVGDVLQRASRASDLLIRWQNDEFVLVARETDPERAERLAERLRSRVADRTFRCGGQELEITCSLGFSSYPVPRQRPGLFADSAVLELADYALHDAKQRGNAWVGLLAGEAEDTGEDGTVRISLEEPEKLVEKGLLEMRRSLSDAAA